MRNEPSENDPKSIWQDQPIEEIRMSLDAIRERAQELGHKTGLQFYSVCAVGLALIAFDIWRLTSSQIPLQRAGFCLAVAWTLYGLRETAERIWPRSLPWEAALTSSLYFARRELERQRDYSRHIWLWSAGPMLFTFAVVAAPVVVAASQHPSNLLNAVPVLILFAVWLAMFVTGLKRSRRKLQREIDGLQALEKEAVDIRP